MTFFVNKAAPVSGVKSLIDYEVSLIGKIHDGVPCMHVKVVVPVTSLCPCSKEISDYGAHNQRSHVTVMARTRGFVWIEELIELVEQEASCELYGVLNYARGDEEDPDGNDEPADRMPPLNGKLGPHRRIDWLTLPLADVRAVRRNLGCTVNDVVLAATTGAVRHYLMRRNIDPRQIEFRISAPVSARL